MKSPAVPGQAYERLWYFLFFKNHYQFKGLG